jgi:hypothetical protein
MRVPYIVGRWVRGVNHYGRQRLIEYLLNIQDDAVWIVGTRRMGKTSLLRQIEFVVGAQNHTYVPLYLDIQGCETSRNLTDELLYAIEDVIDRFQPFGIHTHDLTKYDAVGILRHLNRQLDEQGWRLLLLVDEAEALINIGKKEAAWLARLRKSIQTPQQRTIVTATKLLAQLNEHDTSWNTSPFLFGFRLVSLRTLTPDCAVDLVQQNQGHQPVQVDDATLADILRFSNRHPYLMQYLCQRLFTVDQEPFGYLRPVEEKDLVPDELLSGFFHVDFQHLTDIERCILLSVGELGIASKATLFSCLNGQRSSRISTHLDGMNDLGYIRKIGDGWTVGNEFLRLWIQEHGHSLGLDAFRDE